MSALASHVHGLTADDRRRLETLLRDFDQNWNEKRLPVQLRQVVPGDPLRRAALIELIKADVRQRFRHGQRVKVESYLKPFPELGTADALPIELVAAEIEGRRQSGATVDRDDFARRFPNRAEELKELFDTATRSAAQATRATRKLNETKPGTAAPAGPVALPEQFGRYRIIRKLGQGGMGAVYLAEDSQLGRPVALKVPHFSAEDGPEILERFTREARLAATLNHPNICPVHDVGEIGNIHFVTMAFIEGKPLSALIQRDKSLPEKAVAAVVRKLAVALAEAHRRGVIHRDLKPANIIVNKRSEPVVMDFGLARRLDGNEARLTGSGALLGTPAYMAPEQAAGAAEVGPAADIYALGVILFEMLTGRLPFEGSVAVILGQLLTQEAPPPSQFRPNLDPALDAICRKAMAKQAAGRYASMTDLAAALTAYLKGENPGKATPAVKPKKGQAAVAVAVPAEAEGLATQLLAKLVDRLDDRPAPPPRGSRFGTVLAVFAVLAVIVGLGVGAVFLLRNPPKVENTVVVQLGNVVEKYADKTDVKIVFFLDGKRVEPEKLKQGIPLDTGEHKLKVMGDDKVLEEQTITVAMGKPPNITAKPEGAPTTPAPTAPKGGTPTVKEPPGEMTDELRVLIQKLKDTNVVERRKAADALGKLKNRAAVPALMDRIADNRWDGDDNSDERYSSKLVALFALRALDPSQVTPALLRARSAKVNTMEVRRWACAMLVEQAKDTAATTGLVESLADEAWEVRNAAAKSLAMHRPPPAEPLARALFDTDVRVRRMAAWSLMELGDRKNLTDEEVDVVATVAVTRLEQRIADNRWDNSDNSDERYSSKLVALMALRMLARDRVTPALLAARSAKVDTVELRRWACAMLAEQAKDATATAGVVESLADESWEVRNAAAKSLAMHRPPPAEPLAKALFDTDVRVRRMAAWSLMELGDRKKLTDEEVDRVAAVTVKPLEQRIADNRWDANDQSDERYSSKLVALMALRVLARDRVEPALTEARKSSSPEVQTWAERQLAEIKKK